MTITYRQAKGSALTHAEMDENLRDLREFSQSATYTAGTVGAKLKQTVSVTDAPFYADPTGVADSTAAIQAAITAANVIIFTGGGTFNLTGNISIPSNRKIVVEKGATVINTGGRFTAENAQNVEWQIDGWVKSVAISTAASKPLWTGSVGERGFIEFAENYVAGSAANGFWVHGSGKVSGDWTGTPNASDYATQTNKKGIACWNAADVLVDGLEIFGFNGEAVYASFFDAVSKNIVFSNNYVHDTRHSCLNFNGGTNGGGCSIRDNFVVNCYQLESSVGEISNNYIDTTISYGIFTGAGSGYGPVVIRDNTIKNAGVSAIAALYSNGNSVTNVQIEDNRIYSPYQYAVLVNWCNNVTVRGNLCVGSATGAGAYDIGLSNCLRATVTENTFLQPGGFAQAGRVVIDPTNSFDCSVDPNTNIYLPTTGTAGGKTGNGTQALTSATALLLPALGSVFTVSGVTTITSIAAADTYKSNWDGREIILIFQGILTFTDGSNLKLAGDFVTTADDTIKLICDGTNWFEICRSVN